MGAIVGKGFSRDTVNGDSKHPRPQQRREKWELLNGLWDFFIDADGGLERPDQVSWDEKILVPFSPETPASRIGNTGFYSAVWYRRTFEAPEIGESELLLLHFEAVDYRTVVWVNGAKIFRHEGGYTPFTVDITHVLRPGGEQEIIVRAEDDPADLAKPRG